ncbi:hypothetical protein Hdeb2414_s0027g00686811 [Helianthus debilis subsp. tardiflorus]
MALIMGFGQKWRLFEGIWPLFFFKGTYYEKDIIASRSACIWMQQKNNYDILRMKHQYKDPKSQTLAICQHKI